ncbi:MAG: NAD(P)-dependent oxidoreductase [Verrucomicrobia bacterium]|nr:NAD(P)-dependent oxidoreductase [Verrucomicrobiota bacterium]
MSRPSLIVLGATGLIGSSVCAHFTGLGHRVISVNSRNYAEHIGLEADVLINCNGNSYRYKANQNPRWDFDASVLSVEKSLFDFKCGQYAYISTIDVYPELSDPKHNYEEAPIDPSKLHPYGFHKWVAERLVEKFASRPLILRTGTVIGPGIKKGPWYDLLEGEPLHMSPDSCLSMVDTATIVEALSAFVAKPPPCHIINLTGTGSAQIRKLCILLGLKIQLAPGAGEVVYDYHINNDRLRSLLPVATSQEMTARYLSKR